MRLVKFCLSFEWCHSHRSDWCERKAWSDCNRHLERIRSHWSDKLESGSRRKSDHDGQRSISRNVSLNLFRHSWELRHVWKWSFNNSFMIIEGIVRMLKISDVVSHWACEGCEKERFHHWFLWTLHCEHDYRRHTVHSLLTREWHEVVTLTHEGASWHCTMIERRIWGF